LHPTNRSPARPTNQKQERVFSTPRVEVHLNTTIEDAYGNGVLQGLKTKNATTGAVEDLGVSGLFYGIGHTPNSGLVKGQVELDEAGYVKVGVFVCVGGGGGGRFCSRGERERCVLRAADEG
jgi:thioredoxin reductase